MSVENLNPTVDAKTCTPPARATCARLSVLPTDSVKQAPPSSYGGPASCAPPQERLVAIGCEDSKVYVYSFLNISVVAVLRGHVGTITAIAFDHGLTRIASGDSGGMIVVFDLLTKSALCSFLNRHVGAVAAIDYYGGDCVHFCSAGTDGVLRVWDTHTKTCIQRYRGRAPLTVCRFSPSYLIADGDANGVVRIMDLMKRRDVRELQTPHKSVLALALHPTQHLMAVTGKDGAFSLFDIDKMRLLFQSKPLHTVISNAPSGIAYSAAAFTQHSLIVAGGGVLREYLFSGISDRVARTVDTKWTAPADICYNAQRREVCAVELFGAEVAFSTAGGFMVMPVARTPRPRGTLPCTSDKGEPRSRSCGEMTGEQRGSEVVEMPQRRPSAPQLSNSDNVLDAIITVVAEGEAFLRGLDRRRNALACITRTVRAGGLRAGAKLVQRMLECSPPSAETDTLGVTVSFLVLVINTLQHNAGALEFPLEALPDLLKFFATVFSVLSPFTTPQGGKKERTATSGESLAQRRVLSLTAEAARLAYKRYQVQLSDVLRNPGSIGVDLAMDGRRDVCLRSHSLAKRIAVIAEAFTGEGDGVGEGVRKMLTELPKPT